MAGIVLQVCNISKDTETVVTGEIAQGSRMGLRMSMTIIPIIVLAIGLVVFTRKYILTDEKLAEISAELETRRKA